MSKVTKITYSIVETQINHIATLLSEFSHTKYVVVLTVNHQNLLINLAYTVASFHQNTGRQIFSPFIRKRSLKVKPLKNFKSAKLFAISEH